MMHHEILRNEDRKRETKKKKEKEKKQMYDGTRTIKEWNTDEMQAENW